MLPSPNEHEPGQSLVSRRAISQIVRAAVAGSYGVTGLTDDRLLDQLLIRLGLRQPAVRIRLVDGLIRVDLSILMAAGVPAAEVARQVDSAVRYSIRRAIEREVDALTIHVGGLRFQAGPLPGTGDQPRPLRPQAPVVAAGHAPVAPHPAVPAHAEPEPADAPAAGSGAA